MRIRLIFSLIAILSGLSSVLAQPHLHVVAALPPYQSVLESLGGERVLVHTLIPPGANPHTWEPSPASLKLLGQAQIYFTDSMGIDLPWLPRFKSAQASMQFVNMAQEVQWLPAIEEEHHHHDTPTHHHENESELDPHIWTSPLQMQNIAVRIAATYMTYDPQGIPYYKKRLASFLTRVKSIDQSLRQAVAKLPITQRRFLIFHPSYGYLARDYGLEQMSVEIEGKEPKPADLAKLIRTAQKWQIKTLFVQPEFNARSAETIANEIQGQVIPINPLSPDWESGVVTFIHALEPQ